MIRFAIAAALIALTACSGGLYLGESREHRAAYRLVERARKSVDSDDMQQGQRNIDEALGLAAAYNFNDIKVAALLMKTRLRSIQGRWDEAFAALNEAKKIVKYDSADLAANVFLSEAVLYWESGSKEKAKQLIENMPQPSESIEPGYYNFKAAIDFSAASYEQARRHAGRALERSDRLRNFTEKSAALKMLARIDAKEKKNEEAVKKVKESQEIDRKLSNVRFILWDLEFLGELYASTGDRLQANYYYSQGLDAATKAGDQTKARFFRDKSMEVLK